MGILRFFARKHFVSLLAMIITSAVNAGLVLAILAQINDAMHLARGQLHYTSIAISGALVLTFLIAGAISQWISAKISANIVADLRIYLSKLFAAMQYETLVARMQHVIGVLIEDVNVIAPLLVVGPLIVYNTMIVIACSVYLFRISATLFCILAVGLGLPLLLSWTVLRSLRARFDELRAQQNAVFELLQGIMDGKKEMSLNPGRAEHFINVLLAPAIEVQRRLMVKAHFSLGIGQTWVSTMLYVSILAVIYFGSTMSGINEKNIVPFIVGSIFLTGPVNFIIGTSRDMSRGLASLRHLEGFGISFQNIHAKTEIDADITTGIGKYGRRPPEWSIIRLKSITYRYPGAPTDGNALGPIDLVIHRGETVFIVGGNGSGKSTLLMIICGLLYPTAGQLLVDNSDSLTDQQSHRNRFSSVFSDFYLFSHVLGPDGEVASTTDVRQWLREMRLDQEITVRDGKISRTGLSTGQRKRLALVQCYSDDREIMIFDEWAADQDRTFRLYFYKHILPSLKQRGKTLIVISHDDRFFDTADRVVELEAGRIVSNVVNTKQLS